MNLMLKSVWELQWKREIHPVNTGSSWWQSASSLPLRRLTGEDHSSRRGDGWEEVKQQHPFRAGTIFSSYGIVSFQGEELEPTRTSLHSVTDRHWQQTQWFFVSSKQERLTGFLLGSTNEHQVTMEGFEMKPEIWQSIFWFSKADFFLNFQGVL